MSDYEIQHEISGLLQWVSPTNHPDVNEQYLSQAMGLAYQIQDASIKWKYVDLINRSRP